MIFILPYVISSISRPSSSSKQPYFLQVFLSNQVWLRLLQPCFHGHSETDLNVHDRMKNKTITHYKNNCKIKYQNRFWLGIWTSIKKSVGLKLVLLAQTSPLIEILRSCKYFSHVSNMQTLTYNRVTQMLSYVEY
jgi:hypothetical protein